MTKITSINPTVLVTGNGFGGGGAEARLSGLMLHLFGGESDVAVLSGASSPGGGYRGKVFHLGWKNRWSYPRIIMQLRRLIRKGSYDVVFALGLFPIAIASLAMLGMAGRPKLIISEITRPLAQASSLGRLRRMIYLGLAKFLYIRGDLVTANSIDGLREMCKLIGINSENGFRLPNIMDSSRIRTLASDVQPIIVEHNRYLICVARLDYMKRMDTVVDAFARASRSSECGLVIVGDGEARQSLELQVKKLGIQDAVTFTGTLKNPFPILHGATAFILATEYEGFSNSVLEAMFCDVPVITSYCSADAHEMCEQGAALGFAVGDARRLAEHIENIVKDEALGRKLVSRAQVYRMPHEIKQAIPYYEGVLRSVLRVRNS